MQQGAIQWQPGRYFRSRPSLYDTLVIADHLLDIQGSQLILYQLDGMRFKKSLPVLSKEEQYCAKLRRVSSSIVAVIGMYNYYLVQVPQMRILKTVEIPGMIEYVEARDGVVAVLTSDQEGEIKLLYCWEIGKDGQILKAHDAVEVNIPEFEECSEDRLQMAILRSVENKVKVYVYWKNTNSMVEVDPVRRLEQRYNRMRELVYVTDIDPSSYCEITRNKVVICSKRDGKELGFFSHDKESFKKVVVETGESQKQHYYYTISDQGVKRWQLQSEAQPLFYIDSDKNPVENLYFGVKGELIGVNTEKKFIMVWKDPKEAFIHTYPTEIVKKVIRMSPKRVCLMLEATISREVEEEFQVQKHHKMQVYDLELDQQVAKKAVIKLEYRIDTDSTVVTADGVISFILIETIEEEEVKKHIFKWTPFTEDKKKEVKKREIVGAHKFDDIKLYSFERILTFTTAKGEVDMYDLFGKAAQPKSHMSLFDFNAKKIGDYELSGEVCQLELSQKGQLFAVGKEKLSIYEINSTSKNRLEKVHQLEMSVSFVYPLSQHLLVKKDDSFRLYDADFDLLMREEEEEDISDYRVLPLSQDRFLVVSPRQMTLWDAKGEQQKILTLEGCEPALVELMDEKNLLVANKWIRVHDFQQYLP